MPRLYPRIANFLMPLVCLLCGGRVERRFSLCVHCEADLPWIDNACRRCGLVMPRELGPLCGHCLLHPPPYVATTAPLAYHFPVAQLMADFKYRGNLAVGTVLGELLAQNLLLNGQNEECDLLVPVPTHPARLRVRGFNQAGRIARLLGRRLSLPVSEQSLRKVVATPSQTGSSKAVRLRNLTGAFRAELHSATRVALVDDVITTRATAETCSHALLKAGAEQVAVWAIARA